MEARPVVASANRVLAGRRYVSDAHMYHKRSGGAPLPQDPIRSGVLKQYLATPIGAPKPKLPFGVSQLLQLRLMLQFHLLEHRCFWACVLFQVHTLARTETIAFNVLYHDKLLLYKATSMCGRLPLMGSLYCCAIGNTMLAKRPSLCYSPPLPCRHFALCKHSVSTIAHNNGATRRNLISTWDMSPFRTVFMPLCWQDLLQQLGSIPHITHPPA